MNEFETVGEALDQFLHQMGSPPAMALGTLESCWADVVGPVLAAHSRPAEFVSGVLNVVCDDPAWASQITWSEAQIKTRIAELFADLSPRHLRVRTERPK